MFSEQCCSASRGLQPIHHVGLVVRDCTSTARLWEQISGRRATESFDGHYANAVSDGAVLSWSLRFSFIKVGMTLLELIQPLDERSPHASFLEQRGEGIHHLGFRVDDVDTEAARLETLGFRRIVEYRSSDGSPRWMYLGMGRFESVIELMASGSEEHRAFFSRVDELLDEPDSLSAEVENEG